MNLAIYLTEFNELTNEILNDPLTFGEAINRINKDLWLEAMHDEIQMLLKHKTWTYVYPPKGANIIGTHFVYKIKRLANRSIDKYKAQLVVQGYTSTQKSCVWVVLAISQQQLDQTLLSKMSSREPYRLYIYCIVAPKI